MAGWTGNSGYIDPYYYYPAYGVVSTATTFAFPPQAAGVAPYTVPGQLNMVHTGNYAGLVFSSRGDEANTAGAHQDWASLSQTDTVPAGSSCLSAWFAASLNGFHYVNGYAYGSDAYVSFTVAVGGNTIYSQRFSWFDNAAQLVSPGLPYSSNTYADGDCPYACVNILTNPIEDYPDVPGPWKYLPWTQYRLCNFFRCKFGPGVALAAA
jgi:hypothetical protein